MAPEIINGQIYNKCVDYWAFGCFMHEIGHGKPPFSEDDTDQEASVYDKILTQEIEEAPNRDPQFNEIMLTMMNRDINCRMTMKDVLEHPYLAGAEEKLPAWRQQWVEDYQRFEQEKESKGLVI